MADDQNNYQLNFDVNSNTAPAVQGFQELAKVTSQIREDMQIISDASDGIIERAGRMKQYFDGVLSTVTQIKQTLELVQIAEQTSASNTSNNLMRLNEMISSVKGMGGNMRDVNSILGGGGGSRSVWDGAPTAAQDFSQSRGYNTASVSSDYVKSFGRPSFGPFGGGTFSGGSGGGDFSGLDDDSYAMRRPTSSSSVQQSILDQLDTYPNIKKRLLRTGKLRPGQEPTVTTAAYNDMIGNIDTLTNAIPFGFGSSLGGRMKNMITGYGITPEAIQASQKSMYYPTGHYDENGPIMARKPGIADGVETAALKISDSVARIVDSRLAAIGTKAAGYASVISNAYGIPADIAAQARQYTGMAQTMGGVFGTTDYSRQLGMGLQSFIHSGFNLNPFYSSQDYYQAMTMGASLGLRSSQLTDYANQAMIFKKDYGMSPQQTLSVLGAGLGVGVGVDTNAAYYGQVRNLAAGTNTSLSYANQAYLTGMTNAAGMGVQGSAAAQAGVSAAQFGAGNFQIQANGFTGQEGMGSMLSNALMAQKLGVSYLGLYGAERKLKGNALTKAENATQERLLAMAGIDIKSKYKDKNDFLNKNQNNIVRLNLFLGQLPGYSGPAKNFNATAQWAWGIVQQHQKFSEKSGGLLGHLVGDVTGAVKRFGGDVLQGVRNVVDAPGSLAGNIAHGAIDAVVGTKDFFQNKSAAEIVADMNANNRKFDHSRFAGIIKPAHAVQMSFDQNTPTQNGTSAFNGGGRIAPVHIVVDVHPKFAHMLHASVANGTKGFNNGNVSPNRQPTK
jgi:hypothetical protein